MFQTFFYQPVLNLLIYLYNIVPGNDLGVAIILLTIIIKLLLLPLSKKSIKSQKELQEIQPKVEELKKEYKDNKEEMGKKMMALYKEHKVNPFSSCLPLLIQLPFLIAVFQVFRKGFSDETLSLVYPFIANPGHINQLAFGFIDLSVRNIPLAVLAGASQFWQTKMMMTKKAPIVSTGAKDENMMAMMNKQMMYMMPALTVFIGITLPGGLTFYWFLTTLFTVFQQLYIFKREETKIEVVK
ncbi:MAG: YidC/Oxa1 family membrane protein insertase [Patescibacteria group bacterium]|jgi:YidC/Oxa1 family membrane protein insertase|nr:YidC/Oxa1 family membrane protein insertase [Patescibacteria group bacterium]